MPHETHQEPQPHPEERLSYLNDMPLEALALSCRAYNCLRRAGVHTVADIIGLTDEQLLGIRNLGAGTLMEIREKISACLANHPLSGQCQPSEPLPAIRAHTSGNTSVDVLKLSIDSYNALWHEGIVTISQLTQMSSEQILGIQNINAAISLKSSGEFEIIGVNWGHEHPDDPRTS